MIKKASEFNVENRENMRGGDGAVTIKGFVTPEELNNKGRLFGTITLKPGCGIGYHIHENDSELFYVLKGTAVYNDNGKETTLSKGELAITPKGSGHSVKNESDEDVELIALIVF